MPSFTSLAELKVDGHKLAKGIPDDRRYAIVRTLPDGKHTYLDEYDPGPRKSQYLFTADHRMAFWDSQHFHMVRLVVLKNDFPDLKVEVMHESQIKEL